MSDDLIASLRALAAAQHSDLTFAADAADRIERLTSERDEARADVDRLRGDRDTLLLDARDFVRKHRAEIERLTRERDEARAALQPFSELYLWPDDAGRLVAERVRSREDWDEAANDAESNEFGIRRGEIKAARKALGAKP